MMLPSVSVPTTIAPRLAEILRQRQRSRGVHHAHDVDVVLDLRWDAMQRTSLPRFPLVVARIVTKTVRSEDLLLTFAVLDD